MPEFEVILENTITVSRTIKVPGETAEKGG